MTPPPAWLWSGVLGPESRGHQCRSNSSLTSIQGAAYFMHLSDFAASSLCVLDTELSMF